METPSLPPIDPDLVIHEAVRFLREELPKSGRKRGILGLSGGVDSAVVVALAVKALGVEGVIPILLPYKESNPVSEEDGRLVAKSLNLTPVKIDITPIIDGFSKSIPGTTGKNRLGNVMARARMIALYDLSEEYDALVLGTSNKSELLLGYGTLNGDLASALNPIGDLYKTQVWALAKHLGLPLKVIEKPPSADLVAGQTDEVDLGLSYKDLDKILYRWVDLRASKEELLNLFDEAVLEKVQMLVRRSQFKRQPPLVLKLSNRTVTTDFHHARDWGA